MSAVTDRARAWQDRNRRSFRRLVISLTSPLPRVVVRHGHWVPCWLIRLLLAVLGIATMVVLAAGGPSIAILSGFLLAVLIRPSPRTGNLYCLPLAVVWLVLPTPAVSPSTAALVALGAAIPALASVIESLPLTTRIELRALVPPLLRYLVIQAISQPLVLAAGYLQTQSLALLPLAIVAAVGLAVAAWFLLPRLSD